MMGDDSLINALCVDVDDLAGSSLELGRRVKSPRYCLEFEMQEVLSALERLAIKATFFFPGYTFQRSPDLVRQVAQAGHDIASHGMTHDLIRRLGRDRFRSDAIGSKQALEDIAGSEVDTYKAPCWSITPDSLWAYDILIEAGYRIDHSAMPPTRRALAQSGDRITPFFYRDALAIIPPTTLSFARLPIRFCGGFYNAYVPTRIQGRLLARINKMGLPFNYYFHPYEFRPAPENRRVVKYRSPYLSLYAAHAGSYERHLAYLGPRFRFATLNVAYKRWLDPA